MKLNSCVPRWIGGLVLAGLVGLGAGCGTAFAPKYKVLVDAITVPGAAKPSGQSYRLLEKSTTTKDPEMQKAIIEACVDSALSTVGMFKAPATAAPDVFIVVVYGVERGARADPASRETFLQLAGRSNPARTINVTKEAPEIWDVRVGVMGATGSPNAAMPMLASVAVNYIATDTKIETKIDIPQNAPNVAAVREAAIKVIEGAPSAAANAGASSGSPAGAAGVGANSRPAAQPAATAPAPTPAPTPPASTKP
ncbi:MAG: hypothetical protein V4773_29635 [Verrucomicrobiota bacterium]